MALAECSVAIKCADDPLIERCLDSIDDPTAAINVVATPSRRIQSLLEERGIPYSLTSYGNIARSAQISVNEAAHDNVIVMDSDAYFAPGAIRYLREALSRAVIAKPRLEFLNDGTRLSTVISRERQIYNSRPNHADNPGLAICRTELESKCGYIFNPKVRWAEDADLNYRMRVNDVQLAYVPEAVIFHDPVPLRHELKCAFLYGVGKRLSIENTPGRPSTEELRFILSGLVKGHELKNLRRRFEDGDVAGLALAAAWRTIYLTGYHAQKHLNLWAVEEQR